MTAVAVSPGGRRDPQHMLLEVGRGSRSAFAALYDELSPAVHGICVVILHDPDVAEEATKNAFLAVWRFSPHYRPNQHDATQWILHLAWAAATKHLQRL